MVLLPKADFLHFLLCPAVERPAAARAAPAKLSTIFDGPITGLDKAVQVNIMPFSQMAQQLKASLENAQTQIKSIETMIGKLAPPPKATNVSSTAKPPTNSSSSTTANSSSSTATNSSSSTATSNSTGSTQGAGVTTVGIDGATSTDSNTTNSSGNASSNSSDSSTTDTSTTSSSSSSGGDSTTTTTSSSSSVGVDKPANSTTSSSSTAGATNATINSTTVAKPLTPAERQAAARAAAAERARAAAQAAAEARAAAMADGEGTPGAGFLKAVNSTMQVINLLRDVEKSVREVSASGNADLGDRIVVAVQTLLSQIGSVLPLQ